MSLFRTRSIDFLGASGLIADRTRSRGSSVSVTPSTALRHSAVWACRRLRGDLVSTLPIDVFRIVDGVQVEMSKPKTFPLNP